MKILTGFLAFVFGLLIASQSTIFAVDQEKAQSKSGPDWGGRGMMWNNLDPQKQIDLHEKMADIHKKAAECLKSGKSAEDCHTQMRDNCPLKDENNDCPVMGRMWDHGRKMMP